MIAQLKSQNFKDQAKNLQTTTDAMESLHRQWLDEEKDVHALLQLSKAH